MIKRAFGELESQILYILKSGQKKTVKEVQLILGNGDNYNTVMTVMSRLAEKKQLQREKCGLQYLYWITASSIQTFPILDRIKQKLLGVKTSMLVSHLIETADDLSTEDLIEMEQLLQRTRAAKQ